MAVRQPTYGSTARDVRFIAIGEHARFMRSQAREELLEGPAGTGKTRLLTTRGHERCKANPGYRLIWIRKTLVSLRRSVLPNFEEEVAPGYPWLNPDQSRETRTVYKYPNGSEIILCGMNDPLALRSAEFDEANYFEAHQANINEWEEISGRVRRFSRPFCSITADTNPAHKGHFLFKRSRYGKNEDGSRQMEVFLSRHKCNPKYVDLSTGEYNKQGDIYVAGTLANLTGPRKARLYKGWWVSQSGQVWATFDESENVIPASKVPGWSSNPAAEERLDWYFGSIDWGFAHAGVMQVWGVKVFPPPINWRMYRVCLVYRTQKSADWWASVARTLQARYQLQTIECDPSRPDMREALNRAIGRKGGNWICVNADNRKQAATGNQGSDMGGLDAVRWGFRDEDGIRRVMLVDPYEAFMQDPDPDSISGAPMGGPDERRLEEKRPVSDVEEFPDYIMAESREEDLTAWVPDRPKEKQNDDGCDATRYAVVKARLNPTAYCHGPAPSIYGAGSAGQELDHDATWRGGQAFEDYQYGDRDHVPWWHEDYLEA